MVLQRKTEESSMATKRQRDLLESQKASSGETSGAGNGSGPGIQALMEAIEHELEATVRVHEVRAEYKRQKEEREMMANEVARLKEEADSLRQSQLSDCPGARNSKIFELENMIATSSSTLDSMASQLLEAEQRKQGRWNQVQSLADAKSIMNYLFNLESSLRCMLRDKEVACGVKYSEMIDLKEKYERVCSHARRSEMQMRSQHTDSALKKMRMAMDGDPNNGWHKYDLRKRVRRKRGQSSFTLEDNDDDDDDWVLEEETPVKKRRNVDVSGVCCSCTRFSSCKTWNCECLFSGGSCGTSCGCLLWLCVNKDTS